MRIFLIGKSRALSAFADYFTQNPANIVFSTLNESLANFVDIAIDNEEELKEFALANEITLTILCDNNTISSNISKVFADAGLSVFAPMGDSQRLINSKIWAKKFIYRNKIKTPRFQVFEKPQAAVDYIRQNKFPVVIKPDEHSIINTRICETFGSAKSAVEEFFNTGSRRILTEEYITGKEFSIYALCDGFNPVILGDCAVYQNSFAKFEADFLDSQTKGNITKTVIKPLICGLVKELGEYMGILGFDFILSDNKFYLLECNSFFKDLDCELFIQGVADNWGNLFEAAISGTLLEEFAHIKTSGSYLLSAEIYEESTKNNIFAKGRTFNETIQRLIDEGVDSKEMTEALNVWKS